MREVTDRTMFTSHWRAWKALWRQVHWRRRREVIDQTIFTSHWRARKALWR
jgi:hypothetical protein